MVIGKLRRSFGFKLSLSNYINIFFSLICWESFGVKQKTFRKYRKKSVKKGILCHANNPNDDVWKSRIDLDEVALVS